MNVTDFVTVMSNNQHNSSSLRALFTFKRLKTKGQKKSPHAIKRHKDDLFICILPVKFQFIQKPSLQAFEKYQPISRVAAICYRHPVCCASVVLCCVSSWSLTHLENNIEMDAKLWRRVWQQRFQYRRYLQFL